MSDKKRIKKIPNSNFPKEFFKALVEGDYKKMETLYEFDSSQIPNQRLVLNVGQLIQGAAEQINPEKLQQFSYDPGFYYWDYSVLGKNITDAQIANLEKIRKPQKIFLSHADLFQLNNMYFNIIESDADLMRKNYLSFLEGLYVRNYRIQSESYEDFFKTFVDKKYLESKF